jgi:periplasmic protein TonB
VREHLAARGVYLDVFEQSILSGERRSRPLSFLASISAELIIVSSLIIIPLTYNEHLPAFRWKSVGVGTPLKPVTPKPIPARLLRHASSGVSLPRPFVDSPLWRPHRGTSAIVAPESWDSPAIDVGIGAAGPVSSPVIDISAHISAVAPPPPIHGPQRQAQPSGPVRVSAGVQMAKLMKKVIPEYPPLARSARISGVVHLIGIIGRDGTIRNLQLVSGHPLLARAALEAVQQWIYQPTLLSGEPVEVIAPIDVYFTLGP